VTFISAFTRRDLPASVLSHPASTTKLTTLKSADTSTWPSLYPTTPSPQLFLSALGTTRAAAGSLDAQRAIDYQLNLDLARAAKAAGADTYVLISSGGASATSSFAYPRMKGELEEAVKGLGFKHTVILRPGLIVGAREESRAAEAVFRGIANGVGKLWGAAKDVWAQDAVVIARAAVAAGCLCVEGKREEGVWMVGQAEIVRLGRTDWKE
jgi:hypothetical protein